MNARDNVFLRLRIDRRTLLDNAPKGRLDMPARAAKAIVQIHVPESGVEVVLEKPVHDAAADPNAFRVAGRARHLL